MAPAQAGGAAARRLTSPDPGRRAAVLGTVVVLFGIAAAWPAIQLLHLLGAPDWGSDWRWLADGLDRLARGLPLNRPEYVSGPWSQLPDGPTYAWSLHPPYNASLVAPMLLVPSDARQLTWTWLMAATLGLATWLAWPRGLWWATSLLLGALILGPPYLTVSVGLVDQLHFANPNALVLLGVVLTWHGRRRRRAWLIGLGLVLAAVKIVPAVGLAAWLAAGLRAAPEDRAVAVRGLGVAVAALAALTVPIVLRDPGVIGDTIAVQLNLVPWDGPYNLAPQVRFAPVLGSAAATWLPRLAALALLGLVVVRRLDGPGGLVVATSASLLLTPQLWAHWFLVPAIAVLLAAREWPVIRQLDGWLRTTLTAAPSEARAASPPPAPRPARPARSG